MIDTEHVKCDTCTAPEPMELDASDEASRGWPTVDIETNPYKAQFPLFQQHPEIVFLDSAATAQRPACVLDAERDFYQRMNANPLRGLYELGVEATDRYEAARERVRKFLNARSDAEIIFTRNTTESINLVAYSYALNNIHAGDEIVITIMEHHSNMLPWQMVARQTGAKLVYLECEKDGSLPDEKLEAVIGPKVKLAAIGHVSNVLGCVNPVEKVIELVHRNGGVVLVDAAQSAPHMKVDVQALDADFVAFSGHKLMAPMGIGVLYGKEKLLYAELPHKFEAGTVNAGGAVALAAAIDYLESVGLENVHAQEQALTRYAYEGMKKIPGVNILGSDDPDKHCGILSFTVDGVHPHDIATILDSCHVDVRAGHHCAQPLLAYLGVRSCARASLAFYNTTADIDRFLAALGGVRKEMGYAE